jgi:hypothetical protein
MARLIGQPLARIIGQSIVVENRGGPSGAIGSKLVAKDTRHGRQQKSSDGEDTEPDDAVIEADRAGADFMKKMPRQSGAFLQTSGSSFTALRNSGPAHVIPLALAEWIC